MKVSTSSTNHRDSVHPSWTVVLRGPALLSFGVSVIIVSIAVMWNSITTIWIPFVFAGTLLTMGGMTAYSCTLFWSDLYRVLLQPTLYPAVIAASKWSLDDILTVICDPRQLAASISALFMLPVTLYSLPIATEQRAQVMQAAGLLPADNSASKILTQAGGWKLLLPEKIRLVLQRVEIGGGLGSAKDPVIRGERISFCNANRGEEDELSEDEACYIPYSISPVYRSTPCCHQSSPSFERTETESRKDHEPVELPTHAQADPRQTLEPHELLASFLVELVKSKVGQVCEKLHQQRTVTAVTAVATSALLVAQMRHSRTARACVKSVVHLLLTTGAGTVFTGSIVALLAPYFYYHPTQTTDNAPAAPKDSFDWTVILSSLAVAATALTSVPRPPTDRSNRSRISAIFSLFHWKGTFAAFVFAYFQYRRRQRLHRAGQQDHPR